MTTDTAVRVTRMVIEEQCKSASATLPLGVTDRYSTRAHNPPQDTLNAIPYLDHPELKFNDHESTEMPFRYVKDKDGKPAMPEVIFPIVSPTLVSETDELTYIGHGGLDQEGCGQKYR
jgi:hypothetical protein